MPDSNVQLTRRFIALQTTVIACVICLGVFAFSLLANAVREQQLMIVEQQKLNYQKLDTTPEDVKTELADRTAELHRKLDVIVEVQREIQRALHEKEQ